MVTLRRSLVHFPAALDKQELEDNIMYSKPLDHGDARG